MTWFGIVAIGVLLFALFGNYVQVQSLHKVNIVDGTVVSPAIKKKAIRGIYVGVAINVFLILGVLFVGTGSL